MTPYPSWWKAAGLASMAGAMGWGIRGQYGHETGAMIAGLLVSSILLLLFCPNESMTKTVRAAAWTTLAIGFGGSMTYGQTIGLTHDAPLIGNWDALRWGMLGLALKGAIWISFAGVFLGMGLGSTRYRPGEIAGVLGGMFLLSLLGVWLLNTPFDPANKQLPRLYFSDDWHWEPGADLKPRREVWGGLLFATLGLLAYTGTIRKDGLALRLGLWGALGGALGFPLGQCLQAYHAWNPAVFRQGLWITLDPHMNWWNVMETTFGAVLGGCLGLGLWVHRDRISREPGASDRASLTPLAWALLVIHGVLLLCSEFLSVRVVDTIYDFGLLMAFIPIVAVTAWPRWGCLTILPLTAMPICGKTLRQLVFKEPVIPAAAGWLLYVALPLGLCCFLAWRLMAACTRDDRMALWFRPATLFIIWLYFGLNFAFFHFPWPWAPWTSRTPNGILYTLCALGLTIATMRIRPAPAAPVDASS